MNKYSKTEKTKEYIISLTAPIFNKKGYVGTSITDITTATKLTSGSIYGNFENKEEVALAAFDYNLEKVNQFVNSKVNACKTFRDKLLTHIISYRKSEKFSPSGGGCPLQNTLIDSDDTNERLRERAASGLLARKEDLIKIIKDGINEGEFVAGTNPEKVALKILSLIEFAFLMYSATRNLKKMEQVLIVAEEIVDEISV